MPTQDLISRAARFFVLAEQSFRLDWSSYVRFWDLFALPVVETADHLPAMAAAVKKVALFQDDILSKVTHHPLPGVLPPEAVPWHNRLVAAWEVRRALNFVNWQGFARLALVRLDGCGMPDGQQRSSYLWKWLAEAQTIVGAGSGTTPTGDWEGRPAGRPYHELDALATLAAWRPATRVLTPPETLREWVAFWLERQQSDDPVERGVATIALLNLPEADLRAASIPPIPTAQLLRQLTTAIQAAVEEIDSYPICLLDWQPVKETTWPVPEVKNLTQTWLEVTRHRYWRCRYVAWQQLIRWDRTGSLDIYGIDLLSELVQAVPTEQVPDVLWEMAQWEPGTERFTATGMPDRRSLLRQLEKAWERHRESWHSEARASAWLAGIRLHQAGPASESPEGFLNAYLSRVVEEKEPEVLFVLAQWFPDTGSPGMHRSWNDAWQQRLLDENEDLQQVAAWAFLRRSLEKEEVRSLRGTALEMWRAETKASSEARDILDAAFARFQEVRDCLAAGEVPDFEEKLPPPAECHRPPLALPPGRIADNEWKMENGK